MTPTLLGRVQTRLFLLATVGVIWTIILVPFLPHALASDMSMSGNYGMTMLRNMQMVSSGQPSTLSMDYQMAFVALGLMAGLGVLWDLAYHGLQQRRRDQDWPPLLWLFSAVPEAILLWFALRWVGTTRGTLTPGSSDFPMFAMQFATTWLLVWLIVLGPMRMFSVRWHLCGMELWRPGSPPRRVRAAGLPSAPGPSTPIRTGERSGTEAEVPSGAVVAVPAGPGGPTSPAEVTR